MIPARSPEPTGIRFWCETRRTSTMLFFCGDLILANGLGEKSLDLNSITVNGRLAIKVGKTGGRLTADLLKWVMRKYMVQSQNPKIHHGKQSVKQLVKQGQGVQNIEITDKNIKMCGRRSNCDVI